MSENLVQEVEALAKEAAEKVEGVATEVKAEVVKVVEEVKTDVVKEVEKIRQELSTEEKLAIRELENTYLKAQIEINRLSTVTQKSQQEFTKTVENLTRKYVINPAEWVFDNVDLYFRRK